MCMLIARGIRKELDAAKEFFDKIEEEERELSEEEMDKLDYHLCIAEEYDKYGCLSRKSFNNNL